MSTNWNYRRRIPIGNPFRTLTRKTDISIFDTSDVLQKVEFKYGFQIYYINRFDSSKEPEGIFSRDFIVFLMTAFPDRFNVEEYIYYLTPVYNEEGIRLSNPDVNRSVYDSDGNFISKESIKYSIDPRDFLSETFSRYRLLNNEIEKNYKLSNKKSLPSLLVCEKSKSLEVNVRETYVFINNKAQLKLGPGVYENLYVYSTVKIGMNDYLSTRTYLNISFGPENTYNVRDSTDIIRNLTVVLPNVLKINRYHYFFKCDKFNLKCPRLKLMERFYSDFFDPTKSLYMKNIEIDAPQLVLIDKKSFYNNNKLESITINSPNLKTIGMTESLEHDCFSRLVNLKKLTITGSPRTIGDSFCFDCDELKTINIDLSNVINIGDNFMRNCSKLNQFIINLPLVENIGIKFFEECKWSTFSLECPNLKRIDKNFLYEYDCTELNVDLPKLETFPNYSLKNCRNLTKMNLKLPALKVFGTHNIVNCEALKTIKLELLSLKNINSTFIEGCFNLETINLNFPNLKMVNDNFIEACATLKTVILNFPSLESFDRFILSDCPQLKDVKINAPLLKKIGGQFIKNTGLETLKLDLPLLEKLGSFSFTRCQFIRVDLEFPNLKSVGIYWLSNNTKLEYLSLKLPPSVEIDDHWLSNAQKLTNFDPPKDLDLGWQDFLSVPEETVSKITKVNKVILVETSYSSSSDSDSDY